MGETKQDACIELKNELKDINVCTNYMVNKEGYDSSTGKKICTNLKYHCDKKENENKRGD